MQPLVLALSLFVATGPVFIEDDYPRALQQARAQKKLLLVDAWAPWCHTCISMREQVFSRPTFSAFEKDMVFAAVNTERAKSAAFLARFPVDAWPTLFFIEPVKETVVLKWLGSADETQMRALLEAARNGSKDAREADLALATGSSSVAAQKYQAALEAGETQPRTILSMLSALSLAGQTEPCARTTVEQLPQFTSAQDRVGALTWGLGCAVAMTEGPARTSLLDLLATAAHKALKLDGVLPDDMSGLYEVLVSERESAKDSAGAQGIATQWLTFLESEAAKAPSPASRAVFDSHRVSAALASKQPEKAVGPLTLSEKEFPADYNPPARLALTYANMGQFDQALKAIERALQKCKEGPRKVRLFEIKGSIQAQNGDASGQKKTMQEAVRFAKKLPKSQFSEKRLAALEAKWQP